MTEHPERVGATILSVALLTVMAGAAISPVIANIAGAFPGAGHGVVKLVLTLPTLLVIPFAMISGRLSDFPGKKKVLLTGLFLYLVGVVGGGFSGTIETMLVFRALLGVSVGLIMPLSTAIVSDFFDGDHATKMMGRISASNGGSSDGIWRRISSALSLPHGQNHRRCASFGRGHGCCQQHDVPETVFVPHPHRHPGWPLDAPLSGSPFRHCLLPVSYGRCTGSNANSEHP